MGNLSSSIISIKIFLIDSCKLGHMLPNLPW